MAYWDGSNWQILTAEFDANSKTFTCTLPLSILSGTVIEVYKTSTASLSLSTPIVGAETQVTADGTDFVPTATVSLVCDGIQCGTVTADRDGAFSNEAVEVSNLLMVGLLGVGSHVVTASDIYGDSASFAVTFFTPTLTLDPTSRSAGTSVSITGAGFAAGGAFQVWLMPISGSRIGPLPLQDSSGFVDSSGELLSTFTVPANVAGYDYVLIQEGQLAVEVGFHATSLTLSYDVIGPYTMLRLMDTGLLPDPLSLLIAMACQVAVLKLQAPATSMMSRLNCPTCDNE